MKRLKVWHISIVLLFSTLMSCVFNDKIDSVFSSSLLSHDSIAYADILPEDLYYIEKTLPIIFSDKEELQTRVYPLLGGKSSDRLYVALRDKYKFVFRFVSGQHNYIKQYAYSQMAASHQLGPEIVYHDTENSFFVMKFIEGEHLSLDMMESRDTIWQLGQALFCLHGSTALTEDIFDIFERVEWMIESRKNDGYQELQEYMPFVQSIKEVIRKRNLPYKPSHNDIHKLNIFYDLNNKELKFIDWGDAGLADPFHDLARISVNFALSDEQTNTLLESYSNNNTSEVDRAHLFLMHSIVILQYGCFLYGLETIDSIFKENFLRYCRKVAKKEPEGIETPKDIAKAILDFFKIRVNSTEFKQALALVGD